MSSWVKVTGGVYRHPMKSVDALIEKNLKTGKWILLHPGDEAHSREFATRQAAINAFRPNQITVISLGNQKPVQIAEDTAWVCRPDSDAFWSM